MKLTLPEKYVRFIPKTTLPCALVISVIWWVSCIAKFQNLPAFYLSVSDLSPVALIGFNVAVTHFVPSLELVLAIALLFPQTRIAALQASVGLLSLFCLLLLRAALQKIETDCGCFGPGLGSSSHVVGIARNLILIFIAVIPFLPWKARETMRATTSEGEVK